MKKRDHEFERAKTDIWKGLKGGKEKRKLCYYSLKKLNQMLATYHISL